MIHAWCYDRWRETGHGARFRRKMRDCGMDSIYHDLAACALWTSRASATCSAAINAASKFSGAANPANRQLPALQQTPLRPRFPLTIYEVLEMKPVGTTLDLKQTAARKSQSAS